MTEEQKPITALEKCPHCGDNFGYYQKLYVSGWVRDVKLFENHEPYNVEMYDHLNTSRHSKFYFCLKCNKPITRVAPE